LLLVIVPNCDGSKGYEYFKRAADDRDKQIDIYAPRTVIISQLFEDGTLYGFFMNSVVGEESRPFVIARNVTPPYTIFEWRNQPTVISIDPHSPYVEFITKDCTKLLPFTHFSIAKYDFVNKNIYFYLNETLSSYSFPKLQLIDTYVLPTLTDMFVSDGEVYMSFNCSGIRDSICYNGMFDEVIISNFSVKIEISLTTIILIVVLFILKYILSI
jgi:hypothetical protein